MNDADDEAARLRQQLQTLTHGVSHDLRAPLRSIDTHAAMLARDAEALDDAGRTHLAQIRQAVKRMTALLDALTDLSRVGRAELRPQSVDVSLLAEWSAADLTAADVERTVEIAVQPGLAMIGDERLLRTLFDHVLGNALRFTRRVGAPRISVSGMRAGDALLLEIADNGIGFEAGLEEKIFEPFVRAHGSEDGAQHGIGLAVVRAIAERHGGTVQAHSGPGEGTCIQLRLRDLPRD